MAFESQIEKLGSAWSPVADDGMSVPQQRQVMLRRWQVLLGSFAVLLLPALAWIWSQPAIYQSQSIIHFSYPQQTNRESGQLLASVPVEQLTLNQQRLTSGVLLQQLSEQLAFSDAIALAPGELGLMLSAEAQTASRIITLSATGERVDALAPVINRWLTLFLAQMEQEKDRTSSQDIQLAEQKLADLELRVAEQTADMQTYAQQHNIVSLQRDENRSLSRSKNLSTALDQAEEQRVEAMASLQSAEQAVERGEQLVHSEDIAAVNSLKASLAVINGELAALSERYTEEYMQRDPLIVRQLKQQDAMQQQLQQLLAESQQRYLQQSQLDLASSDEKVRLLEQEMLVLEQQAQAFDQTLSEYQRMEDERSNLEQRAQAARNELIEKEVEKPFEARVTVLERPFVPDQPIGPAYWLQSAMATGIAAAVAILCLMLYSFIVRQRAPAAQISNYTLMSHPSGTVPSVLPTAAPQLGAQQRLADQQTHYLPEQQGMLDNTSVQEAGSSQPMRLLSHDESQSLFDAANLAGKRAILLLLNGVPPQRLAALQFNQFEPQHCLLHLDDNGHSIALPADAMWLFSHSRQAQDSDGELWQHPMQATDFDQLLINTAHDAGLPFAEEVTCRVMRHSCITHFVIQGVRLNELEQRVGAIHPGELSRYRQVNSGGDKLEDPQQAPFYPLQYGTKG